MTSSIKKSLIDYLKRKQVDKIDSKVVPLLLTRFKITDEIGHYKRIHNLAILNNKREKEILNSLKKNLQTTEDSDSIVEIYKQIFKQSKIRQKSTRS